MEFDRAYCCTDSGIVILGSNTVCENILTTLTAVTDCCNTITWSNGQTGNSIAVSAGSYYAMCDGKKSNTFLVTHTGSCECINTTWTNTGQERCINNISEQEQISNCGVYRWIVGGNVCNTNPCISVKFQSILNAPVQLSYQCNGLQTITVPPLGCIVILTINGAWTYPAGTLIPTVGGTCVTTIFTKVRTQSFQRNNCPSGCTGQTVPYSQTYTSYSSQQDADNLANNDSNFIVNGQNYANTTGVCSGGSCTCVSNWVNSGVQQCINNILVQHQIDGCGGARDLNGGSCTGTICNTAQIAVGNLTIQGCNLNCTAGSMNVSVIPLANKTINAGVFCGTNQATVNAQALAAAQALAQSYVNTQTQLCNCPGNTTPTANTPTVTQQPSCANSGQGVVSFTGVTNADRYRYCNGANSFAPGNPGGCSNTCLTPDGTFSGSTFNWTHSIGSGFGPQTYTIRLYNGTNCNLFTDYIVTLNDWSCAVNCQEYHLIQTGNQVRYLDCQTPVPSTHQIIYNGTGECNFFATDIIQGTINSDYALGHITCSVGCNLNTISIS
jgi:hypothetical protein